MHSQTTRDEALRMMGDGVPAREVAARLAVSYASAFRWRHAAFPRLREEAAERRRGMIDEALRMINGGMRVQEAARRLGVSFATVYRWQRAACPWLRAKVEMERDGRHAQAMRLLAGGTPVREVAERFGVSMASVYAWWHAQERRNRERRRMGLPAIMPAPVQDAAPRPAARPVVPPTVDDGRKGDREYYRHVLIHLRSQMGRIAQEVLHDNVAR